MILMMLMSNMLLMSSKAALAKQTAEMLSKIFIVASELKFTKARPIILQLGDDMGQWLQAS